MLEVKKLQIIMIHYYWKQMGYLAGRQVKYCFAKRSRREDPMDDKINGIKDNFTNQYFEQYRQSLDNESVLKDFRKHIFEKQISSEELKEFKKTVKKESKCVESLLNDKSESKIKKYSTKIMQNYTNEKNVVNKNYKQVFKDYADYSIYKDNYAVVENRGLDELENLRYSKERQRYYDFIDSLDKDYVQKDEVKREIKKSQLDLSISEYGKMLEQQKYRVEFEMREVDLMYPDTLKYKETQLPRSCGENDASKIEEEFNEVLSGKQSSLDDEQDQDGYQGSYDDLQNYPDQLVNGTLSLSPASIQKIYELYMQGWNVRDISKRFGILPNRTKFHIWTRARLFDEAIPKHGPEYHLSGIILDEKKAAQTGVADYGIDIPNMVAKKKYGDIKFWNNDYLDAKRNPEEYEEALKRLEKVKKFSRYEILEVRKYGTGTWQYSMQEWNIFRGKGSDNYWIQNKTFKKFKDEARKYNKKYR